jgi:LysR family glycine cleavage system transcriptional activator
MTIRAPRPRMPSLNALRAFEAAARAESFVLAADELGVTPGAVAQQIKQLEAWVGQPLFTRGTRAVRLTAAARSALPQLMAGFDQLATAAHALRRHDDRQQLAICALPAVAQIWLAARLPALRRRLPGVQISLAATETPPNLRREAYDLGLFYLDESRTGVEIIPLEGGDWLLPACSPELSRGLRTPRDLAGRTLLHDAAWAGDWAGWLAFAGETKVDPRPGPTFSLYSLALQAALDGQGVLMGRWSLIRASVESGALALPFALPMPTRDRLAILLPPDRQASPLLTAMVEALQAETGRSGPPVRS